MGFIAICTALYDYQPQSDGELELTAGEIVYVLEKSTEDDWWRAKKKAADEEEEEPEGLVPNNYVEDATPAHSARALYDYTRQTEEEVSFSEGAVLEIFDTSDADWTLVGVDGDYGFAPANYIELTTASAAVPSVPAPVTSPVSTRAAPVPEPEPEYDPSPPASPVREPQSAAAANLARVLGGAAPASPQASRALAAQQRALPQQTTPPSEEEPAPSLPRRPLSQTIPPTTEHETESPGIRASPPLRQGTFAPLDPSRTTGGYHLYNINEMVSAMGRRKKMPITLGLNIATGTIMVSPEKSRDGPTQEWTAEKLEHYSIEGKHVFLELNKPSRSLDLHAGAKDTANEIVRALGDIAGAHRAEGLKEVITAAAGGQKKGVILYDFMAQGDDEVTVAEGDEVIVLDDTRSEEWWNVRRIKNGREGVVPSSYIEVTGLVQSEPASRAGINAGRSTVEQNRIEEERLAKEAAKEPARDLNLPDRSSSLTEEERRASRKEKKASREKDKDKARSKPDPAKVRTWTDHSGSFKVDAQFLGVNDGKIHLHKVNGVKIAVPVSKMSPPDLEYVEKVTNEPLDDLIPLADVIKMKREHQAKQNGAGATIERPKTDRPKGPEYDWFDFFLNAGIGMHQCERYAQAMVRDSMDESVLPDVTMETLRTLGLKEGDALKVMKYIDRRLARTPIPSLPEPAAGGLFTGPGGALLDKSRKRPEVDRSTSDKVDASAFAPQGSSKESEQTAQSLAPVKNGFDDEAWTPKPTASPTPNATASSTTAPSAPMSANLQALSLLDQPLQPTLAPSRAAPQASTTVPEVAAASQPVANAQLFNNVGQARQAEQPLQSQPSGLGPLPQLNMPRVRPQAPQQNLMASGLLPPPRPASVPYQSPQAGFGPLQPQLTGVPNTARPAPPGQSLDEMTAQRLQQYAQLQAHQASLQQQQQQNFLPPHLQPQMTGYPQMMPQPYLNGNASGSPFADPRMLMAQPTGFQYPQPTGVNMFLPPALTPQRTGFQPTAQSMQPNGMAGLSAPSSQPPRIAFGSQPSTFNPPPVPPIPQSSPLTRLVPQKTGPAPDVSFGVSAKKLQPQPTGRANLANATPDNPFGF